MKRPIKYLALPGLALLLGSSIRAQTTLLPAFDDRSRLNHPTIPDDLDKNNTDSLAVGALDGANDFFRSYLTFDLSGEAPATAVTLKLFPKLNENNTSSFNQTYTLFQLAADWHGETRPGPMGTALATFNFTPATGASDETTIVFSSPALTDAFNTLAGNGTLYLGVYSPGAEAAPAGTRSFTWLGSRHSGPSPELQYSANPAVRIAAASPHDSFAFPTLAGASATRTVRYEVVATDGATVTFENLVLTDDPGHPADAFTVDSVPALPVTLGDGQTIDITVTADGSTVGSFTGSLFIDTTSSGGSLGPDAWDKTLPLTSTVSGPPVRISGVYPHLAVSSTHPEVGIGAVVPWADRLWAITYGPHLPNGDTSNKLYEIDEQLNLVVRPESLGGTPANRFIHAPSNQLIIGPHFIDAARNVRNLPYSAAPGRHTGTAAHLSDPENRIYMFTMEDGVYDVNVHDLSFITRYPDVQSRGDKFIFGYHGKGAYSGQGYFIVGNNGRPLNQGTPLGPAGTLARWDGTTYAENGNSYLPLDPINHNTSYEYSDGPVPGQPHFMAGWTQDFTAQHCEVTGPGGIHGNPNPATDPVWATGFDAKSVLVRVLEGGDWNTWRLPKSSYTHDGSHGWHTEWPRIRQLDPATPGSPYLMHMHGLFFDFPATFSSADFSGLKPISSYYKMPVDYCMFDGQLVMAKNDLSRFSNTLALRAQSNFWFGQLEDLSEWGAPQGHGAVWLNDSVPAGESSDPFLVNGFSRITLHLRNGDGSAVPVVIESSNGTGTWSPVTTVNVPANGYVFEILNDTPSQWLRLKPEVAAGNLTAYFILSNPYPHAPVASLGGDRFAALADIRDTAGHSDGIIRPMSGADLQLEFASNHGYHRIGGNLQLQDVTNATAESNLRSAGALGKAFGGDAASVWVTNGTARLRLPRLDPLYDSPFLSGWARGFRETVTEREMLNLHGTFYEVPRDNSGGRYRLRPLATHGKRITDFASWRGLLALTGVLDDAQAGDSLVRSPSGAALWLGEVDDIWQMGEPRGKGGPWKDSTVSANTASDPYLMYGYDRKELTLSTINAATITVEVDFLADNTWSTYQTFTLAAGETITHVFPEGFHAHWVRVKSSAATTATAQFTYGPADQRDALLDWGREQLLPTAAGRAALAYGNDDGDELINLFEFLFGTDPSTPNPWPLATDTDGMSVVLRDLTADDGIHVTFESSIDLDDWHPRPDFVTADPNQSGVPAGFTRWRFAFDPETEPARFVRVSASLPDEPASGTAVGAIEFELRPLAQGVVDETGLGDGSIGGVGPG